LIPLETTSHNPLHGEPAFDRVLAELDAFVPQTRGAAAFPTLTPREHEILELIARGCDNAQIAAHLALSEKTVRNHITNVFDKLGVENRGQAIVRAREAGLGIGR
jgi:DNA-binding NarL/FixJ family response regulator